MQIRITCYDDDDDNDDDDEDDDCVYLAHFKTYKVLQIVIGVNGENRMGNRLDVQLLPHIHTFMHAFQHPRGMECIYLVLFLSSRPSAAMLT